MLRVSSIVFLSSCFFAARRCSEMLRDQPCVGKSLKNWSPNSSASELRIWQNTSLKTKKTRFVLALIFLAPRFPNMAATEIPDKKSCIIWIRLVRVSFLIRHFLFQTSNKGCKMFLFLLISMRPFFSFLPDLSYSLLPIYAMRTVQLSLAPSRNFSMVWFTILI